jgi:hypothetical protein
MEMFTSIRHDWWLKVSDTRYMFCYVQKGKSTKKRKQQHDENKIVEMRTTPSKRSLGNASIGPYEMKFRSLEQNKDPKSIGKRRHKLATSDARRC